MYHKAPEGHAWLVSDRMGLFTEFNDIREACATPMKSWVFVALKQVPSANIITQIRQVMLYGTPEKASWYRRGTYLVCTTTESLLWRSGRLSYEVMTTTFIESYFHSHPDFVHD